MNFIDTLGPSSLPIQLICDEKDATTTPELMGTLASLRQIDKLEVINQITHIPSVE
jgi:3-oxoadipate enol-lactonase